MSVKNLHSCIAIEAREYFLNVFSKLGFHFSSQDSFISDLIELIESLPSAARKGVASKLRSSYYSLESYSDDEFIESLENLSFREIGKIIDYLDETLDSKRWYSWVVSGRSQGDVSYVWIYSESGLSSLGIDPKEKFEDNEDLPFLGENWQEEFSQVLYGTCVTIRECDRFGTEMGNTKMVYGYSIDGDDLLPLNGTKNVRLDNYMKKRYGMESLLNSFY